MAGQEQKSPSSNAVRFRITPLSDYYSEEDPRSVMQNPVNGWPVDRCPNFIGKLATRRVK